ncbi:cytochrome P450 [Absidia repens]|uniref:Cytochrome P450 n=1 Tax=Absidia repens TaxID=90262 RepID=A0A1X2IVK5_9FUNG|nr:cytochrome P450 [Absidia repens]
MGTIASTILSIGVSYIFSQVLSRYIWINKKADGTAKQPWAPSPSMLPWMWNGLQDYQMKGSRIFTEWANDCGHFFSVKLGQKRVLVLNDGPLVKHLLINKDQYNSSKVVSGMNEIILTDNGKTVYSAPFTLYWSRIRRSISGAINSTSASWFDALFIKQSEKLVQAITQAWDESQQQNGGKVNGDQLRGLVDMVSLDTALAMVMEQSQVDPDIMVKVLQLVASLEQEQAKPWMQYTTFHIPGVSLLLALRNLFLGDTSVQHRNNLISYFMDWTRVDKTEHGKKQQQSAGGPPQMAKFMCDIQASKNDPEPEQLKKDEVIINLMHITLHSYKYLSTAIFSMIQRLATLPDIQDQLRTNPSFADAFVKESLRYDPPVRAYTHSSRVDQDIDIGNQSYRVDEDSELVVNLDAIHFDPDYYSHPTVFNPDRFVSSSDATAASQTVSVLDENPKKLPARDHLAFGVGRRFCQGSRISEEFLKVVILNLVHSYTFRGGNTDNVHKPGGVWSWTGRDESMGTTITFEKR